MKYLIIDQMFSQKQMYTRPLNLVDNRCTNTNTTSVISK